MRRLRLLFSASLLVGALLSARAPRAQTAPAAQASPPDAEADRHATLGQRFLERGDGQRAIGEFRRAYELRADPRFLYDIAQSYERIGLDGQARFFYDRYLGAAPDAPDRDEIEERLDAIDQRTARALKAPLPPPAAPAAKPAPKSVPTFEHDVVLIPVSPNADAPPARPLWKRWWVWAAAGAVLAGAGIAVYAAGRGQTQAPPTALGDKTFY